MQKRDTEEEGRITDKREHIGFEIRWIQNLIEATMREKRERNGFCVTQIQHWIINYLDHRSNQDIYQKDLEEEFHVSRATISSTLQVMEKNGLIIRSAVQQDARLKKLTLTERAIEFKRQARQNVDELELCMQDGLSTEEKVQLLYLLRKVRQNLEKNSRSEEEKK